MKNKFYMTEVFLSFDVEADGDAPTVSNMLSIGIVALNVKAEEVGAKWIDR